MTGLNGLVSTLHGLGANWDPGGGGLHGWAQGDRGPFERSWRSQISVMLAGGWANWVLLKSIIVLYVTLLTMGPKVFPHTY